MKRKTTGEIRSNDDDGDRINIVDETNDAIGKKRAKIIVGGHDKSSLESLVEAAKGDDLKFVFVGGKGGVGKTTSSSAIAALLATVCNKRVLLVSTDPAHSLGDVWRTAFSNAPSSPMKNLDVMELDPSEMMEKELVTWVEYANELTNEESSDDSNILSKINSFQQWLAGIPGIDEATALSATITHIESGKYDMIVFDTAPTGHTLKLLALPEILEQGIEKLQSWQTSLWGYWDAFKGLASGAGTAQAMKKTNIRNEISQKMVNYKHNIQKVAKMLQDQDRARFIVVCIAEFLSVSETQRLLQELAKNKVRVSHIIVNQLVVQNSLSRKELTDLESMAELGDFGMSPELLQKTIHACRLTSARKDTQNKYLGVLKGYDEVQENIEGICEVPLLPEEITGIDAIHKFAKLLVKESGGDDSFSCQSSLHVPKVGDVVRIAGLKKNTYLNGIQGTIVADIDSNNGRCGVSIESEGKMRTLALLPKNISLVQAAATPQKVVGASAASAADPTNQSRKESGVNTPISTSSPGSNSTTATSSFMTKAMLILEDPEIKAMIAEEPEVRAAIEDCIQNPMNFTKYVMDPKLSPFISKAIGKL